MTVQINEPWQLFAALISLFSLLLGCGKLLLVQIDRRLDAQFSEMQTAQAIESKHWDDQFALASAAARRDADDLLALERSLMALRAELPLHYVRREDYVRGQSVLEAKLDALYSKLETVQMKGASNG